MTSPLQIRISESKVVPRDRAFIWKVLSEPANYEALMPGIESHTETSPGVWRWRFAPQGGFGMSVRPTFSVRYELDGSEAVRFSYVPTSSGEVTAASGAFAVADAARGTRVTMRLDAQLDLPIPRMLARPMGRLIEARMRAIALGFITNVGEVPPPPRGGPEGRRYSGDPPREETS